VQNECLSIKSRIEGLDGDRQPLVNERCFAAVTRDVTDSSAEVIKKVIVIITIFIERTNSSSRRRWCREVGNMDHNSLMFCGTANRKALRPMVLAVNKINALFCFIAAVCACARNNPAIKLHGRGIC